MKPTLLPVVVVGLLLGASCAPQREGPRLALENGREAFDIDIPADCKLAVGDAKLDFQVFHVTCSGVDYAGVYVGNAADTSIPRSHVAATPYDWPTKVQAWSLEVPNDQARADKIAASVRVRRLIG